MEGKNAIPFTKLIIRKFRNASWRILRKKVVHIEQKRVINNV